MLSDEHLTTLEFGPSVGIVDERKEVISQCREANTLREENARLAGALNVIADWDGGPWNASLKEPLSAKLARAALQPAPAALIENHVGTTWPLWRALDVLEAALQPAPDASPSDGEKGGA